MHKAERKTKQVPEKHKEGLRVARVREGGAETERWWLGPALHGAQEDLSVASF